MSFINSPLRRYRKGNITVIFPYLAFQHLSWRGLIFRGWSVCPDWGVDQFTLHLMNPFFPANKSSLHSAKAILSIVPFGEATLSYIQNYDSAEYEFITCLRLSEPHVSSTTLVAGARFFSGINGSIHLWKHVN